MRRLTKEELRQCQLDILSFIDQVCQAHGLNYMMSYGTLLGAVRHQGFIPWDDDIDISMKREDYERLAQIIKQLPANSRYRVMDMETDDWYFQNFMVMVDTHTWFRDKVKHHTTESHVFVDIFPIDRFDDPGLIQKTHRLVTLRQLAYIKKEYSQYGDRAWKDWGRALVWYALRPVNPRYFSQRIAKLIERYRRPEGRYEAAVGVGKDGDKERYPAGTFDALIDLPFEGYHFKAPARYHEILTQFYGDYHQIPSQEEIDYKSHMLEVYWQEGQEPESQEDKH